MASVAKRYSDALFLAAEGEGAVSAVEADMQLLGIALGERELRLVLADPKRSVAEQKRVLVRLLQAEYTVGSGEAADGDDAPARRAREASSVTLRFLDVVFAKGRAKELPQITRSFHTRVLASRGEVEGRVQSYQELGADEIAALESALSERVGAKVLLVAEIEPELLGGLRVFVGDLLFDASLRGQLEELGRRLRSAPMPTLGDGEPR